MSASVTPRHDIVYFHYERSPYARRVAWYLAFRRIAYTECIQPRILPRPDLQSLGLRYRRTPTMAIGRDIFIDSRMIISRLERVFPPSEQHPAFSSKATAGLAALLNKLTVSSIFYNAVTLLPAAVFQDQSFVDDRKSFYGPDWTLEDAKNARPEGLVHLRECFDILESLLPEGQRWIGGTDGPTLADLEGVWSIDWIISTLSPPSDIISTAIYPKVYKWQAAFKEALEAAKLAAPKPIRVEGSTAIPMILQADFSDDDLVIDENDPVKLSPGADVQLWPTDGGGFTHKDIGRLVKLTKDEVAISISAETGEELRVHAPRWDFKVEETNS